MYTFTMDKQAQAILLAMDKVLRHLSGRLDGFYLAGGTALSKYHFHHRESFDLDFFTKAYSASKIEQLIKQLADDLKGKIILTAENNTPGQAKARVYYFQSLKIDFVQDVFALIGNTRTVDGIPVLSLEDIYLRKIFTACGNVEIMDAAGRPVFAGGRQEAKDFFDLYTLSSTYMPLSKFAGKHCDLRQIESILVWFRRYDRMAIKTGLLDIIAEKQPDYAEMERHFKSETDTIIRKELI